MRTAACEVPRNEHRREHGSEDKKRGALMGLPHPCLMLVTEPRDDLAPAVERAVAGGVDVVLWRDGRATIGKRDAALTGMAAATAERALLIAEGNWETLVRLGLRRIHLPTRSAPVGVVKFRIGKGALVGKSVDSVEAAVQAESAGADYLLVGDAFGADSDMEAGEARLDLLREICAAVRISVMVAGSITPGNTPDCIAAGAAGVAVSSEALRASDPHTYRLALNAAWAERKGRC